MYPDPFLVIDGAIKIRDREKKKKKKEVYFASKFDHY